ncbi:MAG: hypothetical protein GY854_20635 [Deltaproteobacteria bacterium]|nr:hypothetical protein [Deltaproteobacteria bacterium]
MPDFVRNLVAGLSERERRLVIAMGLLFVVFIIFLVVFFVQSGINDLEEKTNNYTKSLKLIAEKEPAYLKKRQEARERENRGASKKPVPLRTLIDKIGKQLDVVVPDMKELPDQRHASLWHEHAMELSMREIGLASLTKFMEEVERNRRKFPIAITKLEVRKRKRTQDSYDVKMVITTYERVAEQPEGKAGKTGKHGASAGRAGGR